MSESFDELLQRVLDGDATPAERAHLEAHLAADPEARNRREEMGRVFQALEGARLEDPPAGLRDDVLRAVRGAAPSWRRAPARTGRPVFSWMRLALPVAGVVAALVVFVSWQGVNRTVSKDRVTGTMSGLANERVERLHLAEGKSTLTVQSTSDANGFWLKVQAGDVPATVVLETGDPGVTLRLPGIEATAASRIETAVAANSSVVIEGRSHKPVAVIRVTATLAGEAPRHGQLTLSGLQPSP